MKLGDRIKELRNKRGISQEVLAEEAGLSLRTVQRIEHNKSTPRGDTLKRLAFTLNSTPDELIDLKIQEDHNYLLLMHLSTLSFIFFPILGIIIPLMMWMFKRDKLKDVNSLGKSILNFQISWMLLLFVSYVILFMVWMVFISINSTSNVSLFVWQSFIPLTVIFYIVNIGVIIRNIFRTYHGKNILYKPLIKILT